MLNWKFVDKLCAKQTGYILNDDGSWSPKDKPHVKDWYLSTQVVKTKFALDMLVYLLVIITVVFIFI